MRVTPEKIDGKEKVFEFMCAQATSVTGHGVCVFDAEENNVLLNADTLDGGTWTTIPKETVDRLKAIIENDWNSMGDGRTEDFSDMAPYFVTTGYGAYFYFGKDFQALRAYIRMAGELSRVPQEQVPKARAVFSLYRRCANLLVQNGIEGKYLKVMP